MARPDFVVVGAGPAGAAFAYYASLRGYRVAVYEQAPRPGMKPCGWAVPSSISKHLNVPGEAIVAGIDGYRVYLDNKLLYDVRVKGWGWIIDKPRFLEELLEGVETHYRRPLRVPCNGPPRLPQGGVIEAREGVVLAPGSAWPCSPGEKISAVQRLYRAPSGLVEEGVVEIWFDSSMVGYYWVFPHSGRLVDIGVGGYLSFAELEERLKAFASRRLEGRGEGVSSFKGARIVVAGVDKGLFARRREPVIGEAAGFVYPLTGEGIRPSVVSAYALIEELDRGVSRLEAASETITWISRQKRLLDAIKRASPKARGDVLRALPAEAMVAVGLGSIDARSLLKILARAPLAAAKLLRYLM